MSKKILALDFDGVIHEYSGWNDGILGPPLKGAVEFVREACQVFQVVVVSSRCNEPSGLNGIVRWLKENGFPTGISVSAFRPPAFVSLDDRAITFEGTWPQLRQLVEFEPWWKA